jgi:hypothetical protein
LHSPSYSILRNPPLQTAHQLLPKEWKSVHALEGICRGRNVRKDDPCLASKFIGLAALNFGNPAELREQTKKALL